MIKIGNILINPDSVDTVVKGNSKVISPNQEEIDLIQIIYKSGVIKNIPSNILGMSYDDFISEFERAPKIAKDRELMRLGCL